MSAEYIYACRVAEARLLVSLTVLMTSTISIHSTSDTLVLGYSYSMSKVPLRSTQVL